MLLQAIVRRCSKFLGFAFSVLTVLYGAALAETLLEPLLGFEGLQRCSIHRLDASKYFVESLPACNADNLTHCYLQNLFERSDGRLHGRHHEPHYLSQYSQIKWISEGLELAGVLLDDPDEADAIFVVDYCYSAYLIASLHSAGHMQQAGAFEPFGTLLDLHQAIADIPQYRATNGQKFTVPYPHVWLPPEFHASMCGSMQGALHITLEATHCYVCPPENRPEQLVVPFPSPAWPVNEGFPILPESRSQLLFFIGSCLSDGEDKLTWVARAGLGKQMRHMVIESLLTTQPPDVEALVSCTKRLPHVEIRKHVSNSKFCLLPPGDSVSSRRLTDIILGGCVPVFIGPPYHNTPFSEHLDYRELGVFLNIQEFQNLSNAEQLMRPHSLPEGHATDLFDFGWWIPTVDFSNVTVSLSMGEIWTYLQAIPERFLAAKLRNVQLARPLFDYASLAEAHSESHGHFTRPYRPYSRPSIIDLVIDAICRHAAQT